MELDLKNPIFVHYINVDGIPRQKAEELIFEYKKIVNYTNVTNWIIPTTSPTKVECIFNGTDIKSRDIEVSNLLKEINSRIDVLSQSKNFEDFKINVRDWRLKEIIENGSI